MILYHGSSVEVARPDVSMSRRNVDFGPGFYTTAIESQAASWCERFKRAGGRAVVSRYELDEAALARFSVLEFGSYSGEWLDFVLACRRGEDGSPYEVVAGGVADDKVFNTIELYLDGLIGRDEALGRLRYERPNHQMCFRTQAAVDACLRFLGSEEL